MGQNAKWICPSVPAASVFEIETSCDADLPIREFAGEEAITIWGRTQL
jgi:hypothetical protein